MGQQRAPGARPSLSTVAVAAAAGLLLLFAGTQLGSRTKTQVLWEPALANGNGTAVQRGDAAAAAAAAETVTAAAVAVAAAEKATAAAAAAEKAAAAATAAEKGAVAATAAQTAGQQRAAAAGLSFKEALAAAAARKAALATAAAAGPAPAANATDVAAAAAAAADPTDHAVNLVALADKSLTLQLVKISRASQYSKCAPTKFNTSLALSRDESQHLLMDSKQLAGRAVWAEVGSVPCNRPKPPSDKPTPGCCTTPFSFRFGSTDIRVHQQIYTWHFLRFLYALWQDSPPKYILDAGANAGYSAALFKMLAPDAIVVALEPDPGNFEALKRNTQQFTGVHALNAGLWGWAANITVQASHGDWGKVFKEAPKGEPGMPAYGVKNVAAMFNISKFDYVKIDVEGAEGMVFAPGADTSWVEDTDLISMEVHDSFAPYFALTAVSGRVDAALGQAGFQIANDNEHLYYLSPKLASNLMPGGT